MILHNYLFDNIVRLFELAVFSSLDPIPTLAGCLHIHSAWKLLNLSTLQPRMLSPNEYPCLVLSTRQRTTAHVCSQSVSTLTFLLEVTFAYGWPLAPVDEVCGTAPHISSSSSSSLKRNLLTEGSQSAVVWTVELWHSNDDFHNKSCSADRFNLLMQVKQQQVSGFDEQRQFGSVARGAAAESNGFTSFGSQL